MMDVIDDAQRTEESDRALALEAMRQRIAASFAPRDVGVDGRCIDCDEPIESARIEALGYKTSRCIGCARDYELRMRGYR